MLEKLSVTRKEFDAHMKEVSVFISYKWQDPKRNSWVERLYKDLRLAGIDAKLDKYEVAPGDSFSDYMTRGIRKCDYVLFIITPRAVRAIESGKGALAFEMEISNARRIAAKDGFRIIPIFREGKATSTYLADHRYIDFRQDTDYNSSLDLLIQSLLGELKPPPIGNSSSHLTDLEIKHLIASAYRSNKFLEPEALLQISNMRENLQFHFWEKYKNLLGESHVYALSVAGYAFLHGIASDLESIGAKIFRISPHFTVDASPFFIYDHDPEVPMKNDLYTTVDPTKSTFTMDLDLTGVPPHKNLVLFDLTLHTGFTARAAVNKFSNNSKTGPTLLIVLYDDRNEAPLPFSLTLVIKDQHPSTFSDFHYLYRLSEILSHE